MGKPDSIKRNFDQTMAPFTLDLLDIKGNRRWNIVLKPEAIGIVVEDMDSKLVDKLVADNMG